MVSRQKLRAIGFRVTLLLGSITAACVLGELTLRALGVSYPWPYEPDERLGSRLRPGWSGWFTKEGRAFVRVNKDGFRDREHPKQKPPRTLRILVLGDSFVEAVQVAEDKTFWAVLERELSDRIAPTGQTVEVIARGISGWGTAQEFLALEHGGLGYDPDLVLLAFFAGNDLRNNSRELEPDPVRPFFVLRGDQLVLDDSFRQHPRFVQARSSWTRFKVDWINRLRTLQLLQEVRQRWSQRKATPATSTDAGIDQQCFLEPESTSWHEAWNVTVSLILRLRDECRVRRVKFGVALITCGIQVHPEPRIRESYQRRIGVDDLGYSDRQLAQVGQSQEFPVFVLAEPLRAYAEEHREFLHGFANTTWGEGHWNEVGHRVAGEFLADEVAQLVQEWNREK